MNRRFSLSLKASLLLVVGVCSLLMVGYVLLIYMPLKRQYDFDLILQDTHAAGGYLRQSLERLLLQDNVNEAEDLIVNLCVVLKIDTALVVDKFDRVILSTRREWLGSEWSSLPSGGHIAQKMQRLERFSQAHSLLSPDYMAVLGVQPIATQFYQFESLRPIRRGRLLFIRNLHDENVTFEQRNYRQLFFIIGAIGVITILLLVLLNFLIQRRTYHLAIVAERLSHGDFTARSELSGNNELDAIGIAFNNMAEALESTWHQLELSETLYRNVYEKAPIGVLTVDDSGIIHDFNIAALDMFGYPGTELLGKHCQHLILEEDSQSFSKVWLSYLAGENDRLVQERFQTPVISRSGNNMVVEIKISDLGKHEGKQLFALIVHDITQRVNMEKIRQRFLEELQTKNQALEDFTYAASHDLQEPLRKVIAYGDFLMEDYADVLDEEGRSYIERMQRATERMQTLINDLLQYSRVTTTGEAFQPVDLGTILQEVEEDLEIALKASGSTIQTEGTLPTIHAEPLQMRQLLQNLLSNAIKFSKPDVPNVITVSAKFFYPPFLLEENTSGDNSLICVITVTDNGIGFDPKFSEKIFGMFTRLHGHSEYEGTGVGLAICQKIAAHHGGSITAYSEGLNQGATFSFQLPINSPVQQENEK